MTEMRYLDFDLLIEGSEGKYLARVLNSPCGESAANFNLPFSDPEFNSFLARIEQFRGNDQRALHFTGSSKTESAKGLGERLYNAVFNDNKVGTCLLRSFDKAKDQEAGLRIRLRLTALANLPWEYLYCKDLNDFLALSDMTPIVRYLEMPKPIQSLQVKPPLKVLVMISSPKDHPQLDVENEWMKLENALSVLMEKGLLALERLEAATFVALQKSLGREKFHIFHFIGHGGFDQESGNGVLLFENQQMLGHQVDSETLGMLLGKHSSLRLAVLNACEGGRTSSTDPFAGLAQSLLQQGIPATVAMQFPITDSAAITFAQKFYEVIAEGGWIESALSEARLAIFADNKVEWATPVLYMRATEGRIFEVAPLSEEEKQRNRLAALRDKAEDAIRREDWKEATEKLNDLLSLDKSNAEVLTMLRHAEQQPGLPDLYAAGQAHYEAARWREALVCFLQVQEIGGDYKGVFKLIANAKLELEKLEAASASSSQKRSTLFQSDLNAHYGRVIKKIIEGNVVPFFGAGVNLCGRPPKSSSEDDKYLPSHSELVKYLTKLSGYPEDAPQELAQVAQYFYHKEGRSPFYEALRELFTADYPITPAHQFLATLPKVLRKRGFSPRYQLIVTTNYDDALERAFTKWGEPFFVSR
jgi:hypothetical protein